MGCLNNKNDVLINYSLKKTNLADKFRRWTNFCYKKQYSKINLVLLFFSFAFIGYIYEILVNIIIEGTFANKGMLYGPIIPIYGIGGILILVLLKRYANTPIKLFASAMVVCGILEFGASYIIELVYHAKYWDYSNYFLNIQGRTCLLGLIIFGILGLVSVYFISPIIDKILNKIPPKIKTFIAIFLLILLVVDIIFASIYQKVGMGITY